MTDQNNFTNKELLYRIDERQRSMARDFKDVKTSLEKKVDDDEAYQEQRTKVNTLWDMRNKILGYAAATGLLGSMVYQFATRFVFK